MTGKGRSVKLTLNEYVSGGYGSEVQGRPEFSCLDCYHSIPQSTKYSKPQCCCLLVNNTTRTGRPSKQSEKKGIFNGSAVCIYFQFKT